MVEKKNNWGGRRAGAGRPIRRSELEFKKFSFMDDLSDADPVVSIQQDIPCQTAECPNRANQAVWQMEHTLHRPWSLRPICKTCLERI